MTNQDEFDAGADEADGAVHRTLVTALGDAQARRQLGDGQWLGAAQWALAIERAYATQHGHLPRALGLRQVGRDIVERLLASEGGAALASSVSAMTGARLVSTLLPLLSMRLRRDVVVTGSTNPVRLTIEGHRAAPDEVTVGALEALARRLAVPCGVRVSSTDGARLELELVEDPALARAGADAARHAPAGG